MNKYSPFNKKTTKHLNIILLLVALFCSTLSYTQCPSDGNLYISNQTQIDNFSTNYPGCTEIPGWIYISESVPGNITNLNGLSAITSIGGSLYFNENTALTSLSGLNNLTSIGSFLSCLNNDALTSFAGLENVASIGAELYISGYDALTSLNGLDNLASIAGFFYLGDNPTLASINGLNTLASIGGYISINNNNALTSLSGLDNVASIAGELKMSNNAMLTSLNGLDNIAPAGFTNLVLENNPMLSVCEVASICSYLGVTANSATISGNATGCSSRIEVENVCYTDIPDANFEQKLIDLGIDTQGGSTDGRILTADAEAKTGALQLANSSISNLTGIEAFINITYLNCSSNQLTNLNISLNPALSYLNCSSNQLSNLDVSQNMALVTLYCQSNQLTSLDVSQNTGLIYFICSSNQLTSLDVSLNSALKDLRCTSNQLSDLDLRNGNNTNFTYFNTTNNSLSCISVDDPAYSTANWIYIDPGVFFDVNCLTALPIELLYIRGEAHNQSNLITWATASEENTEFHVIEYSDGKNEWKEIGRKDAVGFSSQTIQYEFIHQSPSTISYYRLKSMDFDDAFQVSNTIAVERESDHFELVSVFPNPTESNLSINFNLDTKNLIKVTLADLSGRIVAIQNHDGIAGINQINFDLSRLNAGMYFVHIDNGKEKLQRKIVKQ